MGTGFSHQVNFLISISKYLDPFPEYQCDGYVLVIKLQHSFFSILHFNFQITIMHILILVLTIFSSPLQFFY